MTATRVILRLALLWLFLAPASVDARTFPWIRFEPTLMTAFTGRDTLVFDPTWGDSIEVANTSTELAVEGEDEWLRPPFGDNLLTDIEQYWSEYGDDHRFQLLADYNRVDRLRLGAGFQMQSREEMLPRLGARYEYSFGRQRPLYGAQIEQPLIPPGRIAVGVSMVRRTDHGELHQVEDVENSLAFLFGRQDYRDYFEREGFGAYVAWRVPDFSTVSVHLRNDEYRTLTLDRRARSFFQRDRHLRENPAIDEGASHSWILRLERLTHHTRHTHAGLYHWIELERSGNGMGGDFDYTRLLGDVRSVVRLSPATTLALRLVAGHRFEGRLPVQKQFTAGGVDGLRAHQFAEYRGDRLALGQAEYTVGLWRMRSGAFESGLHAIAFLDAGTAWFSGGAWDVGRQLIQADGGLGLSTSEDNVRLYLARNLREPGAGVVLSLRLQRPF